MIYTLDQTQFKQFRNKLLGIMIPIMLIVFAVSFIGRPFDLNTLLFMILLVGSIAFFVFRHTIRQQKRAWETFELKVLDETVERQQAGFPQITLYKKDISKALVAKNGAIVLVTKPQTNNIIIPSSVQNQESLLEQIAEFTVVEHQKSALKGKLLSLGLTVLFFGSFYFFFTSSNFYVTASLGIAILSYLIWTMVMMLRNKNLPKQTRWAAFGLPMLMFPIITKLYLSIIEYLG